jgi:hypothetical protein
MGDCSSLSFLLLVLLFFGGGSQASVLPADFSGSGARRPVPGRAAPGSLYPPLSGSAFPLVVSLVLTVVLCFCVTLVSYWARSRRRDWGWLGGRGRD